MEDVINIKNDPFVVNFTPASASVTLVPIRKQSSALKKEIQIKQFQASLIVLFGFLFIRDHGGI